jgi:DeoR family transcriptional regulator, fructose operon transcriptional repressor
LSLEAIDRIRRIQAVIEQDGLGRVSALAAQLGVSEMTIRRDLDLMAKDGSVHRVRGGAVAVGPQPFTTRFTLQPGAKDRIAAKLAELVGDGGAVGIDASSTLQRLASAIGNVRDLTVLTNGLETFAALATQPGISALLTGGVLDRRTGSLVGPFATRNARTLLLRRLFVSAAAVHPEHGSSEATLAESDVKLALADVSAEVILAVDSSKLGQRAPALTLAPARVTMLVTELDPCDARLDPFRERWTIR